MSPLALEYDSKFRYNLDFFAGMSASKEIREICKLQNFLQLILTRNQ